MVTCLALLLIAGSPVETSPLEPLLDRLQAHAARLDRIYWGGAFTLSSKLENLDRKAKPSSTTEVVTRVSFTGGVRHEEVVKRIENGKDVTVAAVEKKRRLEEQRTAKKKKKKEERNVDATRIVTPFDAKERDKYRFSRVGHDPDDATLVRIGFSPAGAASTEVFTGFAVVDEAAGTIIRIDAEPSRRPAMVDKLRFVIEFAQTTPAGPTPSELRVDGEGGLLFIRKRVRIRSSFTDYVVPD